MNESYEKKADSVYSKRLKAGKRRTYFFDVRATRGNDYFLTITESRKRQNDDGYDRHKIFLYKEDFNKFLKGLHEAVDFVKTDLMPDFDFDSFNHDGVETEGTVTKPEIASELLEVDFAADGKVLNGAESTVAHKDIIDGAARPGFDEPAAAHVDGQNGEENKPMVDGKPVSNANHTEDVDRW